MRIMSGWEGPAGIDKSSESTRCPVSASKMRIMPRLLSRTGLANSMVRWVSGGTSAVLFPGVNCMAGAVAVFCGWNFPADVVASAGCGMAPTCPQSNKSRGKRTFFMVVSLSRKIRLMCKDKKSRVLPSCAS